MLLDFRVPPYTLLEKCVSHSGVYLGFYGNHYHENRLCYVVGASDKRNGAITTRHYNEKTCVNQEAAKFASSRYWESVLKPGLLRAPSDEESTDMSLALERWFEHFDREHAKRTRVN